MQYVIAAALAALIGGVEQYNRLGARFTLKQRAWVPWLLRILLEAGLAVGALAAARGIGHHLIAHKALPKAWWSGPTAGIATPAFVRLRVFDYRSWPREVGVGPAALYVPLRHLLEEQIEKRSATQQSVWMNHKVLRTLKTCQVAPDDVGKPLIDYVNGLAGKGPLEKAREQGWIEETLNGGQTAEVKRELLARHAVDELGAHGLIDEVCKEAERAKKADERAKKRAESQARRRAKGA